MIPYRLAWNEARTHRQAGWAPNKVYVSLPVGKIESKLVIVENEN